MLKSLLVLISAVSALALAPGPRVPKVWNPGPEAPQSEPRYVIAIIDTGYNPKLATIPLKLCKTGHYDAITNTNNPNWSHPHGTRIANIIAERLKDVDYCAQIINYYRPEREVTDVDRLVQALNHVQGRIPDFFNLSYEGIGREEGEEASLRRLTEAGAVLFAAAGNGGKNLDFMCNVYPACYKLKNLYVVGAKSFENPKERAPYSNYGKKVDLWAGGYAIDKEGELCGQGTSYAAPRALSEYVLWLEAKRLKRESNTKTH